MSLPIAPNTTCDIYRTGTSPPAVPSVAGVRCYLKGDWRGGQEAGDRLMSSGGSPPVSISGGWVWTHLMLVDVNTDVRDAYAGGQVFANKDTLFVPDKNGTKFLVVFVERVGRGTAFDYKRVYLDRTPAPTWPTDNV